jgi:AcrR family transcriptional regulator
MDDRAFSATKTRILEASKTLFNDEGAGALSAVDIAAALEISPGHLYYHFKGKPEILAVLAADYQNEIDLILEEALSLCRGGGATLETLWTHVHILVEEAWDARFLHREAGALALRYPDVGARLRRIAVAEREALRSMLSALAAAGVITAPPEAIDGLARLMTTAIAFHALQLEMEGDPGPPRARLARAAAQIMGLVAAFVPAERVNRPPAAPGPFRPSRSSAPRLPG